MARILAIDDELDMLTLIKNILIKGDHIVDIYQTTVDIDENSLGKYDLILLDVMMPEVDGISYCKNIRSKVDCPIIFLTAKAMETDIVDGLLSGGDDYITKPFGIMELISRVKALLRRSAYVEEKKFLTLGNVFMDDEKHAVYVSDQVCELTYKEYELLKLLMSNAGIVTARDTIMERIWGIDFEGESRTLDMHIKTLRKKLGEAGSMIKTVRNVGYIMSDKEN